MALRNFEELTYLPMLTISVAEMRALEELPEKNKDILLPYFQLRPWGASHELDKTLNRLSGAYGDRPMLVDLSPTGIINGERRPVHDTLDMLRLPAGGYASWCDFIADHSNMIPTVQLGAITEVAAQVEKLADLERGLGVYVPSQAFSRLGDIAQTIAERTDGGRGVCLVLDLGQRGRDLLTAQATSVGLINSVRARMPLATIALSASSFPGDFVGLADQEIFERQHYNGVVHAVGAQGLVYSDRGSARAEKQMGGGGTPAPRVDLAGSGTWSFFRDNTGGDRSDGYVTQARAAKASGAWDGDLRVWGVQLVERTAGGDRYAIKSPASSAAARINIHLHQQLYYGDDEQLYATDEEWND